VPEGQFDPDELTRRLYVVLAEQKAHAERKQRARGETSSRKHGLGRSSSTRHHDSARPGQEARQKHAEPPADLITELRRSGSAKRQTSHPAPASDTTAIQPEAYHHVPKEAAKQFTRTTTVENMRSNTDLVHKLSKRALKFHLEGPSRTVRAAGAEFTPPLSPEQLTHALQQTQTQRAQLLDRNQFQRTRILEEAARLDHHSQQSHHQSPRKHTFQDELARFLPLSSHQHSDNNKLTRRNSTGTDSFPQLGAADSNHNNPSLFNRRSLLLTPDLHLTLDPLLEDSTTTTPPGENLSRFPPADRARVDWTQSDELRAGAGSRAAGGGPKLLLLSPLLRKADSIWGLKGRRGSKDSSGSGKGGEKDGREDEGESPKSPTAKAGKGFFGRFKR
jgi:hypothetical protein